MVSGGGNIAVALLYEIHSLLEYCSCAVYIAVAGRGIWFRRPCMVRGSMADLDILIRLYNCITLISLTNNIPEIFCHISPTQFSCFFRTHAILAPVVKNTSDLGTAILCATFTLRNCAGAFRLRKTCLYPLI